MDKTKKKKDFLWLVLFIIIFINGFEAGGLQACLYTIGQEYGLNETQMGLFASVELFATMLAPLLLQNWADKNVKTKCISILLGIQFAASIVILFTTIKSIAIFGVFFLGLTTSALQFISLAALADAYPISSGRKLGYMTSMYALGASLASYVVKYYLSLSMPWRTLFIILAVLSFISFVGIIMTKNCVTEAVAQSDLKKDAVIKEAASEFYLFGILLLCVIMFIYVGFENGFNFFVDTLFIEIFKSDSGKFALSLVWIMMIPSRLLVGRFASKAKAILIAAIIGIPVYTIIISFITNSTLATILCIPLGFACGAIYPCVLNIMLPFAGRKTATATGLITISTGIGGFVFTALTGYMGDLFGLHISLRIIACFFIFSLISAICAIRLTGKKQSA